ncbi:beta-L-arabinofuranosidase domain-containing protein [Parasegetibacter sp. NRK P23]|uniref:beta-L-arabinofuranosidase domain-containing protein n=1 Tax=Parasegetibacter sp. NRK P23 TaxID=2942999 RepID=UPI0020446CF2|nr:beta-L-arabinofuranosidase domain-containing protein [Parasegetibacter sp. NRK P23]MCM5530610.1 glycoside hydrolase family 127 protein [Parasegetibacter sp. NRK P23]
MRILIFVLVIVSHLTGHGQHPTSSSVVRFKPFPAKSVTLTPSWIKQQEMVNIKYLTSLDPDRLLHNFRVNAQLPSEAKPLEGWEAPGIGLRGHFVGHYLSAIATVVENYGDTLLKRRLTYLVDELYKCQQKHPDKYLSAFPERDFDTLEKNFGGVWAPYYTYHKLMQGMLDAYVRTGNTKAYQMLQDMAAYVEKRMARLSPETIEKVLYSVGANPSNEAGAMNEVLYALYKVSGEPRHLALARIFDRDWFAVPLAENRNILSGLHANTHLVLVNGFSKRYEVTKEEKYGKAAVNFWNMLMTSHAYVNGSSSGPRPNVTAPTSLSAEHWGVPGHLSSTMTRETSESCVSHNTQKLTATLFTWTGKPAFADAYMNTFYNSTMALQSGETGRCVYHLPLGSPRKKIFLKEDDFRCCNGSSIEAFSALNTGIYYHNDTGLWVNLFVPSKLSWPEKKFTLEQKGNFTDDQEVEFTITTGAKTALPIHFLAPSWAKKVEVFVNGQKQETSVSPNSYITLKRAWKHNDQVRIKFQFDFYIRTMPDDSNVLAIFYGPILLAFEDASELILKGTQEDILKQLVKEEGTNVFSLKNNGKTYRLKPFYAIEDEHYGVYATIRNY